MTPWESFERAIQFLLEHAAKFDARLQQTQEQIQHTQQQLGKTQQQIEETAKVLRERGLKTDSQIAALAKQNEGVSQEIRVLKDACRDLLDNAHYADWRLNRLEHPNS